MDKTNADRQRRWRDRRQRDNKAMMEQLAALQGRVAQLEAELAARPQPAPRKPSRRVWDPVAALKRERDELAERLAKIEAYQPGIAAEAAAWIAEVDAPPKRRRKR